MKRIVLLLGLAGLIGIGSVSAESVTFIPKKYKEVKLTKKGTIKKKYLRRNGTLKKHYRVAS